MIERSLNQVIKDALAEDIGSGDITTSAVISNELMAVGKILTKQSGVAAGLQILKKIAELYDPKLQVTLLAKDGEYVNAAAVIASIKGKAKSILTVERTALNFLQRMSGIATLCKQFKDEIAHTKAKVMDTRKTAPGLRLLDKLAVKIGGCSNHRIGLFDMFLIKDNHIAAAGSITQAVKLCKKFRKLNKLNFKIEVETANLVQVKEAVECKVDVIMLDNFNLTNLRKAVKLINGKCLVEASGNVNLETVKPIAETGVDFISVGAITHSIKAFDMSLELELIK